jgi:hypothetical protein
MTTGARRFLFVAALLIALAGCGNDSQQETAPTTTSTTAPDPAIAACPEHINAVDVTKRRVATGLDQLTISRDARIVAASREVERILDDRELETNPVPPDLDIEYAEAELELARACKVAGYLP